MVMMPQAVDLPRRTSSFKSMSPESKLCKTKTSELEDVDLFDQYRLLKLLGSGTYGTVHLAEHKPTKTVIALKILQKCSTKLKDFQREFHVSYFLSAHHNIIATFDVAFQTNTAFCFAQEYAPYGDLFEAIPPHVGLCEETVKSIMKQVVAALEWMHSQDLVHRDIKPENVMIFDDEFTRVKLIDFGMTRKEGTLVKKQGSSIPYTPYEICNALTNEGYVVEKSADVWAFAVLLFSAMTGNFPWEKAELEDPYFREVYDWQKRKTVKIPSQWRKFTPRLMRLFRKLLEVKAEKRCQITEIRKYLDDRWVRRRQTSRFTSRTSKTSRTSRGTSKGNSKHTATPSDEDEDEAGGGGGGGRGEHVGAHGEAMAKLTIKLKSHGIETITDAEQKQKRVSEWILAIPES